MAEMIARDAFNIQTLDLHTVFENFDDTMSMAVNWEMAASGLEELGLATWATPAVSSVNSFSEVGYISNNRYNFIDFLGHDLGDITSNVNGGVINLMASVIGDDPGPQMTEHLHYGIRGLNLPTLQLFRVMNSDATSDDRALFASVFSGNDRFDMSEYNDWMSGFLGNDRMLGNGGNDTLTGEDGLDTISGGTGADYLSGGTGNDNLTGGADNDTLSGGLGVDTVDGGSGNDTVRFESRTDADRYSGGIGTDTLDLSAISQVSTPLGTVNILDLATGHAYGTTFSGFENVLGSVMADAISGDALGNRIDGADGSDRINGRDGNDMLIGGSGADTLTGGNGTDALAGGVGSDQFVFTQIRDTTASATTADRITDFVHGTDRINLSAIDASSVLSGNNAFVFLGTGLAGTAATGAVTFHQFNNIGTSNDYTLVYLDTDADAAAEAVIRLTGLQALTASDFLL